MLRDEAGRDVELRLPVAVAATRCSDDDATVAAAWQSFHQRLRGFVSRRVRDAADAEDIVQRVFLQMHRTLPNLRDTDRLGAWLYQAARNAIVDHYRAPRLRREVSSGDTRTLDPRSEIDLEESPSTAESACAAECLASLVEQLPAAYRGAIEQVELRGVSQRAAAASAGVSVSGMKARVQRGRRRLKALMLDQCNIALDGRGGIVACGSKGVPRRRCGTAS